MWALDLSDREPSAGKTRADPCGERGQAHPAASKSGARPGHRESRRLDAVLLNSPSPGVAPAPVSALRYWAEHCPDQLAVVAEDGSYTFAELHAEMVAVAAELIRCGVGAGDAVEIGTGQSRATAAGYLACWLTGATAVPIDPSTPPARLEFLRRDAGITARIDSDLLAGAAADRPDAAAIENLPVPPPESTIAYLIYTSGTTGEPKGVEVTVANLNCLCEALRTLRLPAGGVGINPVSAAYDGWLWCFLLYLISGQRMHLLQLAAAAGTLSAGEAVAAVGPTTVCVTPSILRLLDEDLLTAEVLVVAGEVCTPDTHRPVRTRPADAQRLRPDRGHDRRHLGRQRPRR